MRASPFPSQGCMDVPAAAPPPPALHRPRSLCCTAPVSLQPCVEARSVAAVRVAPGRQPARVFRWAARSWSRGICFVTQLMSWSKEQNQGKVQTFAFPNSRPVQNRHANFHFCVPSQEFISRRSLHAIWRVNAGTGWIFCPPVLKIKNKPDDGLHSS